MAELTKKLNIQKTGSSTVACKIYSTATEAGANYMRCTVDGVNGYIPLGTTSDTNATVGRVTKSGSTYAIKSQSKPPYTETSYTTAGTHTLTVPAGVTRMRVAVCGGGGGGNGSDENSTAGAGGTSSFGSLIQATGGSGGRVTGADNEGWDSYGYPGTAGTPNGKQGDGTGYLGQYWYGPTGFTLSFTNTNGTYGAGGNAYIPGSNRGGKGSTGGSGGYNSGYITVTPNTTYTVTVGTGGTRIKGYSGDTYTKDGTSGFVLIAYGGDI